MLLKVLEEPVWIPLLMQTYFMPTKSLRILLLKLSFIFLQVSVTRVTVFKPQKIHVYISQGFFYNYIKKKLKLAA